MQRIRRPKQQDFIKECLVERSKSIDDVIHCNKQKLFLSQAKTKTIKNIQPCQTRDGNLSEFFHHENQAYHPALSDCGNLYLGTKSAWKIFLRLKLWLQ